MRSFKSSDIRALSRHMAKHYDTEIIKKSDAAEMKLVAVFLKAIGVMDKKDFLRNYATTIGDSIYLPFSLGSVARKAPSLLSQVMTIVHEHQHVVLSRRVGEARYNVLYLTSKSKRAVWEAECYRSNLEMYRWYKKARGSSKVLRPADLAGLLAAYGCSKTDIKVAAKILTASARVVNRGGVANDASVVAIRFLRDRLNSRIVKRTIRRRVAL